MFSKIKIAIFMSIKIMQAILSKSYLMIFSMSYKCGRLVFADDIRYVRHCARSNGRIIILTKFDNRHHDDINILWTTI